MQQENHDANLLAEFFSRPVEDRAATKEAGRVIHKECAYVRISVPGDKTSTIERPATDSDKARFSKQWAAFQANESQEAASGTLLSVWGALSAALVADYRFMRVHTVEQLAGMSDGNVRALGIDGNKHRQMAKDFLEGAKSNAPLLRMQAELQQRDAEVAALREALKQQGDRLEALATGKGLPVTAVREVSAPQAVPVAATTKKRGRPAKQKELS